nr:MAG TPA: hypothetical protein [Caudoviricetes sp.]
MPHYIFGGSFPVHESRFYLLGTSQFMYLPFSILVII